MDFIFNIKRWKKNPKVRVMPDGSSSGRIENKEFWLDQLSTLV